MCTYVSSGDMFIRLEVVYRLVVCVSPITPHLSQECLATPGWTDEQDSRGCGQTKAGKLLWITYWSLETMDTTVDLFNYRTLKKRTPSTQAGV